MYLKVEVKISTYTYMCVLGVNPIWLFGADAHFF